MKVDYKGLRFKLWGYFVTFSALIMIVLWLLQIVFIGTYYRTMKANEIKKIGDKIVQYYCDKDFTDINNLVYKNGIFITIFEKRGNEIVFSNNDFKFFGENPVVQLGDIANRISKSSKNKVVYITTNSNINGQNLVYGALLSSNKTSSIYLSLNAQIAPIDATVSVLQNQLVIIIFIALLMSFILSYFISLKISRPIINITHTAESLGKGNYDVNFEKGNYTEISKLAATLNYATRELSKTDELRKDLIANVSHDLRTPLTMIKMYAEMIRDISGDKPEKRNAHTKVIIDETDRLTGLVNDLLNLSRIQSGTEELERTEFDLTAKVSDILSRFDVLAERNGYIFKLNCDENAIIYADEKKIEQVIYNLVSNAVNYTGDDKSITISVKDLDKTVKFAVTDTGKGIPKEKLQHIWERYYKAKETHKRAVIGTGLGLSIVKGILTSHDALFGVDSTVGKGSTFWFEIIKPTSRIRRQSKYLKRLKGNQQN